MNSTKNNSYIYGFEDYNILILNLSIFKQTWEYSAPYSFVNSGKYLITKNLPYVIKSIGPYYDQEISISPSICENHKELLLNAKKVYAHPACKLSRSMIAEKYKKSLNPYFSDVVVVPKPNYRSSDLALSDYAVFINEKVNMIILFRIYDDTDKEIITNADFKEGDTIRSKITCNIGFSWRKGEYNISDLLDSKFMSVEQILITDNNSSYISDILINLLPNDKIVYEESLQQSLGSDDNQLTLENMVSIADMINSSDDNTVAAGLKALSMMDWVHYPNSIKYILNQVDKYKWFFNKACSSTSVKFMLNNISNSVTRRRWPGDYTENIYEQDFNLFKQLKMHYENINETEFLSVARFINFMWCNADGVLTPRLKTNI